LRLTIRCHSSTGASTTGPSSICPALLMRGVQTTEFGHSAFDHVHPPGLIPDVGFEGKSHAVLAADALSEGRPAGPCAARRGATDAPW